MPLRAQAGETYVLAVDQFIGGVQPGYTVRLSGRPGSAGISAGDAEDFIFTDVQAHADSVVVSTKHLFECGRLNTNAVSLYNPQNPSQAYTITSFGPAGRCVNYTNRFALRYTPYDSTITTDLNLVIQDSLIDVCLRVITRDTIGLRSGPRVAIKSKATLAGFTIYPQPNSGQFQVDLRSLPRKEAQLIIYEAATGRKV